MATLENYLEDVAMRLYEGFKFPKPDEQRTTEEIIQAFDEFAIGESSETFECNKFKSRKQEEEGDSFDNFYAARRVLSKTCNCLRQLHQF